MTPLTKIVRFCALAVAAALIPNHPAHADDPLDFGAPYTITGPFVHPYGIAIDAAHGRLLVADTGHHSFQWMLLSQAAGTPVWTQAGYVDNRQDPAALTEPQALTADGAGNVFVVNSLQGQVKLYRYTASGYSFDPAFCAANPHVVDGTPMLLPRAIAAGPDGSVYLLDSGRKRILKASGASAAAWSVWRSNPAWKNPYGIAVDTAGLVYITDTDNHRVIRTDGQGEKVYGYWGTDLGQFRYPRGIAVASDGRIFVADTFNHRVQVLSAGGQPLTAFGHAPQLGAIEKIAVDASNHVFVVDSDAQDVIAYLGAAAKAPYDVYLRDYPGDTGAEPSSAYQQIATPDVLVRHQPDILLSSAAMQGLESYVFQEPQYGANNYLYLAVHNRGTKAAADTIASVYAIDPADGGLFPKDWKSDGFYASYADSSHNQPGNHLLVPIVSSGGVTVVGPLLWRPPKPESAGRGDGVFRLAVRLSAPHDNPPNGDSTAMSRESNNVSERLVAVTRATTGAQNTLVLRANYSDISGDSDFNKVEKRCQSMAVWIDSASNHQTQITLTYRGPVTLPHAKAHYTAAGQSVVIDLVQDALNKLLGQEPDALDGAGAGQEITRVIIVTNDLGSNVDWATTGSWPYHAGGKTRTLTASVQAGDNSAELFSHGVSHQLGLIDLYPYSNVFVDHKWADGWDTMAKPIKGAFPLVWSKERAHWISDLDAKILFVPRPAPGVSWTNNGARIHLTAQELAAPGKTVAVALGLTNGVSNFRDETAFYMIEMRKTAGGDAAIPMQGVLVYRVDAAIPQGQTPIRVLDYKPGTKTLNDAAMPADGGTFSPPGAGITIKTHSGTHGADTDLSVTYKPPVTDYDVLLHAGKDFWLSPDIWIDNKTNGFDEDEHRTPKDRGDQGIAGEKNRVYARVFNTGPADAREFEIAYAVSQPFHTVGGKPDFGEFHSIFIDKLKASDNVARYVTWNPETGIDPHTCVQVTLRRLTYDTVAADNVGQHNFEIDHSVHGSPYTPAAFHFQITNSTDAARTVYFRADGLPAEWPSSLSATQAYLAPGQSFNGTMTFTPAQAAADCSQRLLSITGWTPDGDTLIPMGGSSIQVDLQRKTKMTLRASPTYCAGATPTVAGPGPACRVLEIDGQLTPGAPAQTVSVRYANENGEPVYHSVQSSRLGVFHDQLSASAGTTWAILAQSLGTTCQGPASASQTITVALPKAHADDPDLPPSDRAFCLGALASPVQISFKGSAPARTADCPTRGESGVLTLSVGSSSSTAALETLGTITVNPLHLWQAGDGGIGLGHFVWLTRGGRVAGELTTDTTGFMPARMWLSGIVQSGALAGARVRALVANGRLVGAIEQERDLLPLRREQRLLESAADPVPCGANIPSLRPVQAEGQGTAILHETGQDRCPHGLLRKSWETLSIPLAGGGTFAAASFEKAASAQAGEQGAAFVWTSAKGRRIEGELTGLGAENGEGLLRGLLVEGQKPYRMVRAFYRLQFGPAAGRSRSATLHLRGFIFEGCYAPYVPPTPAPGPVAVVTGGARRVAVTTLPTEGTAILRMADETYRTAVGSHSVMDAGIFAQLSPLANDVSPAALLKRYDRNHDGQISAAEAPDLLKNYAYLDVNHDGKLTAEELGKIPAMVPARRFAAVDTNHDGKIDLTEFVLWYRTLPSRHPSRRAQ